MQPRTLMKPSRLICLVLVGFAGYPAVMFGEEPATTANDAAALEPYQKALDGRIDLAAKLYGLNEDQVGKLRVWAQPLLSAQVAYMEQHQVTLRRREQALATMVDRMESVTEDTRQKITHRMQMQIYRIHGQAPLSFAKVVGQTESMLSPEAVKAGREAISNQYADILKGEPLAIADIDRLIIPPVEVDPDGDPVFALNPSPAADTARAAGTDTKPTAPMSKEQLAAERERKEAALAARTQANPPSDKTAPPPPPNAAVQKPAQPQAPLEPAPDVAEWDATVRAAVDRYGFDQAQSMAAFSIAKSCKSRAMEHKKSNQEAYAKAAAIADDAEKQTALKALDGRYDQLYAELKQRVAALASVEQENRAAAAEKSAGADTQAKTGS